MEILKHKTNIDFLGKRRTLLAVSAILVGGIAAAIPFRVNLGVDFAGGTEIEVKFAQQVGATEVREKIEAAGFKDATVQEYGPASDNAYLVRVERISILTPEQAQALQGSLEKSLASYEIQSIDIDQHVGDKIDVRTAKPLSLDVLRGAVESAGVALNAHGEAVRDLSRGTTYSYQVLTEGLSDRISQALHEAFGQGQVEVRRVEYVGPQVGQQLRNRGVMAVLFAMIGIVIYVAFRFQPKFAPGALMATLHDVAVVMGYYVVTGREFNLTSIAVLLTMVGFSINDTIVVYDRVREIEGRRTGKSLEQMINQALNETLSRTLITSGVTALSLIGLLVYGVGSIQDFAGAMLVGIVSGTYSTIYIAGPFAIWTDRWLKVRAKAAKARAGTAAAAGASPKVASGRR